MRNRLNTLVAAATVGATFLIAPSTANAATARHCWTNVETGESACFASFAEVVEDLSGGQVTARGGPESFSSADAAVVAAAAEIFPLGTIFENWSYTGASNVYVSDTDCDTSADVDFQGSLVGTSWNDRTSSFKSHGLCETRLWTGVYTGTSYGYYVNSSNVGTAMNDQASSIQWR